MLPPQYCTTAALYEHGTPADALVAAASRDPAIIMPTAEVDGETVRLALPGDVVELSTAVGARL